jgi:hypothetical protein
MTLRMSGVLVVSPGDLDRPLQLADLMLQGPIFRGGGD